MPPVGTPLTVREAIAALEGGARASAHVPLLEDGIGRPVELSTENLLFRFRGIDGDESTRFVLDGTGSLILT
jgi:CTP:molybdopterin cytidylyltransferase MocA